MDSPITKYTPNNNWSNNNSTKTSQLLIEGPEIQEKDWTSHSIKKNIPDTNTWLNNEGLYIEFPKTWWELLDMIIQERISYKNSKKIEEDKKMIYIYEIFLKIYDSIQNTKGDLISTLNNVSIGSTYLYGHIARLLERLPDEFIPKEDKNFVWQISIFIKKKYGTPVKELYENMEKNVDMNQTLSNSLPELRGKYTLDTNQKLLLSAVYALQKNRDNAQINPTIKTILTSKTHFYEMLEILLNRQVKSKLQTTELNAKYENLPALLQNTQNEQLIEEYKTYAKNMLYAIKMIEGYYNINRENMDKNTQNVFQAFVNYIHANNNKCIENLAQGKNLYDFLDRIEAIFKPLEDAAQFERYNWLIASLEYFDKRQNTPTPNLLSLDTNQKM